MSEYVKIGTDGKGTRVSTERTGQDKTQISDDYARPQYTVWRTGADMTAGGSYGIWGLARVGHSVQNALGTKGHVYFGDLASSAKVVNQCRGIEGGIDLSSTYDIGVLDDISSIGGYLGPYNAGDVATTAGGTLSVVDLVFLPETNMSVDTHGIKLTAKTTSAGVRMDYGLRIQNQGISTANIFLENENNSKTAVVNDILMSNTAGDVTNGINMSSANYSGADIILSNGLSVVALTTAITANTTTTTKTVGSMALTSNATGRGKLFVSDGSKWQYMGVA